MTSHTTAKRPRVAGEREADILMAALDVLRDVGYDRLTFDAVAAAAKASKATLYRRWPHKRDLVVDAVELLIDCPAMEVPDTGSLRGDLLAQACAQGGLDDEVVVGAWGALLPALHRDRELLHEVLTEFVGPKVDAARQVFLNAQARGEIGEQADLETLLMILPAMTIHEALLTGRRPGTERIRQIVDVVVLPACQATNQPVPS